MAKNPYREGTKYHMLFDLFSKPTIPSYPVLLKKVNNAFPGNHTTVNAMRRFKTIMRREGYKIGRQDLPRTPDVPTPRRASINMEAAQDRVRYAAELLSKLGYEEAASWLRE